MQDNSFRDFVLDQLRSIEGITSKSMFGGVGIYCGVKFFGIIYKERLYFKTSDATRAGYEKFGMKPFKPSEKQTLKNYYELPVEILEEAEELSLWAKASIAS